MHLLKMNSWFFVRVSCLTFFKKSIKTVLESSNLQNQCTKERTKTTGCGIMKHLDISRMLGKEKCICSIINGFFSECEENK